MSISSTALKIRKYLLNVHKMEGASMCKQSLRKVEYKVMKYCWSHRLHKLGTS